MKETLPLSGETVWNDRRNRGKEKATMQFGKKKTKNQIKWLHQEEGFCEGVFQSRFFHNDEDSDELSIGAKSPALAECAEKCVEEFNGLSEAQIREICQGIIDCVKEIGAEGELELPDPDHAVAILKHCWFTTLYVNMLSREDEIAYVVEGEGDWGEGIGFAVQNGKIVYVGVDYFACMKAE